MTAASNKDYRWWLSDAPRDAMFQTYDFIWQNDTARREAFVTYMRLYGNRFILGITPDTYDRQLSGERVTLNIIKSVCDTVTSRIAKNRPRPTFLTSGGNYSLQRRARLLEKFVDGQFYLSGMYDLAPKAFLDACVFGTGVLKIYREGPEIKIERVFPGEIYVDKAEGFYGEPQNIYQVKYIARDVLMEMFPDKAGVIRMADKGIKYDRFADVGRDSTVDQVRCVEAWHLASGPDAKDGRHQIAVDSGVLLDEEYTRDYFPFVFTRWSNRLRGFFGIGLGEELIGLQIEINSLLMKIQRAFELLAVPWVLVEGSSKIKKAHLNNQIGAIIPYVGTPPIVRPNQTMSPEVFAHLDRLYSRAYEIAGVSQLSATSIKPAGLESGKALRTYNDIESERFAITARDYEKLFLDAAKMIVNLGKEISEEDPSYSVVAQKDKHTIEEVKWSDVDLDADSYVLKVFPTSSLPNLPAGRLAFVEQLVQTGFIGLEEGKKLLDFPDLERSVQLDKAASDSIDRIIEKIIDNGEYEAPEPYMDLQLALKKVQAAYNKAVNDGVPEAHLRKLRQFLTATNELLKLSAMEQQNLAQQPLPGAPPAPGPTGAPPTAVQPTDGTVALA